MARRGTRGAVGCISYPGGKVLCHVNRYSGAMRKHGSDRQPWRDPDVVAYEQMASVRVAPMGVHGLVIRRKVG